MKLLKTVLILSLMSNLVLLACLMASLKTARKVDGYAPPASAIPAQKPLDAAVSAATTIASANTPAPFRWSQLDSGMDYHAYVANLRTAGCPERIVRAIVMADVESAFSRMRSELNLDGTEAGRWSEQNQERVTSDLLGEPFIASPAPVDNEATTPAPTSSPSLPLVFQNVDPASVGINGDEKSVIQDLQKQFLDEIGPENPSDPAYRERWMKAQPEIDDSLRAMIGNSAFQDYQAAAQNAATASSSAQ
jgi:hypothetical protein